LPLLPSFLYFRSTIICFQTHLKEQTLSLFPSQEVSTGEHPFCSVVFKMCMAFMPKSPLYDCCFFLCCLWASNVNKLYRPSQTCYFWILIFCFSTRSASPK
jgi:hypothetical protein